MHVAATVMYRMYIQHTYQNKKKQQTTSDLFKFSIAYDHDISVLRAHDAYIVGVR